MFRFNCCLVLFIRILFTKEEDISGKFFSCLLQAEGRRSTDWNWADRKSCFCEWSIVKKAIVTKELRVIHRRQFLSQSQIKLVAWGGFGGLEDACWPLVPKFADSNPAERVGFFKAEKIPSTPSFGGEVKPAAPLRRFSACKRSLNVTWKSAFRQKLSDTLHRQ
jgi:hypothetical protein